MNAHPGDNYRRSRGKEIKCQECVMYMPPFGVRSDGAREFGRCKRRYFSFGRWEGPCVSKHGTCDAAKKPKATLGEQP
jgi:hypothetical protein